MSTTIEDSSFGHPQPHPIGFRSHHVFCHYLDSSSNETVEKLLFMMITVAAKRTVKKAVIFAECRC